MTSKEVIKRICKKCGARCCKFGGVFYTEKEKSRILKAGFKDYFIPFKGFFATKPNKGNCPYLKGISCSIHEVRPTFCRIWPVFPKIINKKKKYYIFSCPLAKHIDGIFIKKAIKLANKLPNKIYEICWEAKSDPDLFEVFKPRLLKNLK